MEHSSVVILAGGQGSRFWPVSRMKRPKQFLSIASNGESLLQATARRVESLSSGKDVMVITNVLHKPLIQEHLPQATIVCEPMGRNTAASIGLAALFIKRISPSRVMVVLPADHAVSDEERLRAGLIEAIQIAEEQKLIVTVGVKPTFPHTGYGYVKRGSQLGGRAYEVDRFYEKPNLDRAKTYFESPEFYWNSGMFVWRADVILAALKEFMPSLYEGLMTIDAAIGGRDESKVIEQVFQQLESISIDFGVLEHARNCAVIAAEPFGWNDVGSWDAWAEHFEKDPQSNLMHGDAILLDSTNCVVQAKDRMIAVLGARDLVIIDSGDALLVCPRDRVQDVRKIVDELKRLGRSELM